MWLLHGESFPLRYSEYRFAAYRVAVAGVLMATFVCLPASVVVSFGWELSTVLRWGAVTLGLVLAGLVLIGVAIRWAMLGSAAVLLLLAAAAELDPRLSLSLVLLLGVASGFPGRHRLTLGSRPAEGEVSRSSVQRWYRAVWVLSFLVLFAVPLFESQPSTPWVLGAGALVALRVFLRGPVRWTGLVAFGFALAGLFTVKEPLGLFACWLLALLLAFDERWLSPQPAASDGLTPSAEPVVSSALAAQPQQATSDAEPHSIVFFDGVCSFCNDAVQFILAEEWEPRLHFAALQGETARRLLPELGETMVFWHRGAVHQRSDAALHIARSMGGFWKILWVLRVIPRSLRDVAYRFFARHRYRWFGKLDACLVPKREQRLRFLP